MPASFDSAILALNPLSYHKLDEAAGATSFVDSSGNAYTLSPDVAMPTLEQTAIFPGENAVCQTSGNKQCTTAASFQQFGLVGLTVAVMVKLPAGASNTFSVFKQFSTGEPLEYLWCYISASGTAALYCRDDQISAGNEEAVTYRTPTDYLDEDVWYFVVFVWNGTGSKVYVNGVDPGTVRFNNQGAGTPVWNGLADHNVAIYPDEGTSAGCMSHVAHWQTALSAGDVANLWAEVGAALNPGDILPMSLTVPLPATLPMALAARVSYPAANLPVALSSSGFSAQATIPLRLDSPNPAHYLADVAAWSALVFLDGVALSRIVGEVLIEREENTAAAAELSFLPSAGSIDLASFENKKINIDFIGRDSMGAQLYATRRFTGKTSRATYDPDAGTITLIASDELLSKLEAASRPAIAALCGGHWSEHVFNDSADGWQYAQDRLSTTASEVHCNVYGVPIVVPFAAGQVAATYTDAERFNNTLRVRRASRRDLITRVVITLDFRFVRLRHREIVVRFVNTLGLCGWLNGAGRIPAKSVIQGAADGNSWVRVSDIAFDELPLTSQAGICGGTNYSRNEGDDKFALGARWRAARRWAQKVNEVYTLTVTASDLEGVLGELATVRSYGIEAIYDAADYEADTDFTGPPSGAILSPATDDYQVDADDAERTGRDAMGAAQTCALGLARTLILSPARENSVSFDPKYDPSLTLEKTARVNTPGLKTTGKVRAITERLNQRTGRPSMTVTLAVSRHDGAGMAADDPLNVAAPPPQTNENPTARTYVIGYRLGGTINAPIDNADWDGWISNAYGDARTETDATKLYRERFVLRMPEIEQAAREATDLQAVETFDCVVPEDELTLTY